MMKLVFKALNNPNPDLRGNVVLMHDSGGDRSRTLELLPKLIDTLKARGLYLRAALGTGRLQAR